MPYLTANDRPGEHAPSWYAATAAPLPDHPPLKGEAQADVCVIGGGFAGLSAALHLAERGMEVVLLEANRLGWGASGRNGGQLGVGPRADKDAYEAAIGREGAKRAWEIAVAANRLTKDLIARHGIACDLKPGYLDAAWRPRDADELKAWAEAVERDFSHDTLTYVPKEEMPERLGTTRYHGGVHDSMAAHLHPLNYALGLGRAAAAAGVRLHERSPATEIGRGRVRTAGGTVRAEHILVACNGYLDGLVPEADRRIFPINNYIIVTEPMGDNRAAQVNRDDVCVSDTKFVLNYYRLTPDKRMLWGGGESYGKRFPRDLTGLVRAKMLEVYPDLADLRVDYVWGGTLAITTTRMPSFSRPKSGLWVIGGWSGSGIHMATMGGQIAAEAIAGTAERWDFMAKLPTPQMPGGRWFRAPLQAAAMTWYALRDRL